MNKYEVTVILSAKLEEEARTEAIEKVKAMTGAADIVSFGDNINDLSMIEAAGTGIAMGNAEDTVKRAADDVAGTNDEGGVGEYLLQLLEARQ